MLFLLMLLSCKGANFSNLKLNSSKTFGEKSSSRNVSYVIGEDKKEDKEEDKKEDDKEQTLNVQMNYLGSATLLDILNKDKKDFEEIQIEKTEDKKLGIDYSESKTLLDILDEENKNFKSSDSDKSSENFYESDSYSYGYEKTVGYKDEFFC